MQCFYINLDASPERRANLEANFHATAPTHWRLARISATTADEAQAAAGSRPAVEKACFLSHRRAVAETLADSEPVMIVEDDTQFCARTFSILDSMVAQTEGWDLLYPDLTLLEATHQVHFAKRWSRLAAKGEFLLTDLARIAFAGAGAYVLRGEAKQRLVDLLDAQPIDLPYDIRLARLVHAGQLSARMAFPYLTTMSADADASTIQPAKWRLHSAQVQAMRRLMFVERDLDAIAAEVSALAAACTPGDRLFGQLTAISVADDFPDAWS